MLQALGSHREYGLSCSSRVVGALQQQELPVTAVVHTPAAAAAAAVAVVVTVRVRVDGRKRQGLRVMGVWREGGKAAGCSGCLGRTHNVGNTNGSSMCRSCWAVRFCSLLGSVTAAAVVKHGSSSSSRKVLL